MYVLALDVLLVVMVIGTGAVVTVTLTEEVVILTLIVSSVTADGEKTCGNNVCIYIRTVYIHCRYKCN